MKTLNFSLSPYYSKKLEVEKLDEAVGSGVKKSSIAVLEKYLRIPEIKFNSNSRLCKIVQVTYEVKVDAKVSGFIHNMSLIIPITIGTVPLDTENTYGRDQCDFASTPSYESACSDLREY